MLTTRRDIPGQGKARRRRCIQEIPRGGATPPWPGRAGAALTGLTRRNTRAESRMNVEQITLPKKYHDAVEHWRRHWMPDYESLLANWDKYFPKDDAFCLCAKM